jgi:hypothetical protein
MRPAIKCTCSHCLRETYFSATVNALAELSTKPCERCGKTGAVITLNVDAPNDADVAGCSRETACDADARA